MAGKVKNSLKNIDGFGLIYGIFDRAVMDLEDNDTVNVADAWLFLLNERTWYEWAGLNKDKFLDLVLEG